MIFALQGRWILTHFSSDGYLQDSGWIAYLFESADPLLHNPSGVNNLSFYAHHLSPHIFLFGIVPSRLFHFSGIQIFAYHQGVFFGLFFLSLYLLVGQRGMRWPDRMIAILSATLVGALGNALFQAAAYPHYEIAMLSIASFAVASWFTHCRPLFTLSLVWLPLVREDGGFYVAVVCLTCLAVEYQRGQTNAGKTARLLLAAFGGVIASAISFTVKSSFFPGFDAFTNNFSGHSWDHVTLAFTLERLRAMVYNMNILPVLLGCALLAIFDLRYAAGLLLVSPVLLLHLLAVRPEHGHFTLYFALPWLFPCAVWLAVFVNRSQTSARASSEGALILAAALALSAPVQALAGARGQFWYVAQWSFQRPVVDIASMKDFVLWARRDIGARRQGGRPRQRGCVSQGIAALIPNSIDPDDVVTTDTDLRVCEYLLLMHGDIQYPALSSRALAARFERVGARRNAEIWLARNDR
jgi:hypothetical protein